MGSIRYEWSAQMKRPATVSDQRIATVLQKIADLYGNVTVTSGDRTFVPNGGASNSLHLAKEAADIHVTGKTDEQVFDLLIANRAAVFGNETRDDFRWQIIIHGPGTLTEGKHVHIGYVDSSDPLGSRRLRGFIAEGLYKGRNYPRYTIIVRP